MSSDFLDNYSTAGSWKRSRLLGGETVHLSLGKNMLKLAFCLGFLAWSDRCEAQPPPIQPSGLWVITAALHILAPEPVTSSCAELAKLCHLSVTVFILIFPPFSSLPSFEIFCILLSSQPLRSAFLTSTPMGMTILIMFSCHALSSLSISLFPSLTLMPFPLFSLLPWHPLFTPRFKSLGFSKAKKKKKILMKRRTINRTGNHLNSLLNIFPFPTTVLS